MLSFWSDITCGANCWEAKEELCKCSCGGKNHGSALRGETAIRTAKIDGIRYQLEAVGTNIDLASEAVKINQPVIVNFGWDSAYKVLRFYKKSDGDRGAVCRVRYATDQQVNKWQELSRFAGQSFYHSSASLLWIRCDRQEFMTGLPVVTEKHIESKTKVDLLTPAQRNLVWYETMYRITDAAPDLPQPFPSQRSDFHIHILDTLELFNHELSLLTETGATDGGYSYWLKANNKRINYVR